MNALRIISFFILVFIALSSHPQSLAIFKAENNKYGYKKNDAVAIEAQYDTALAFDCSGRIAAIGKASLKRALGTAGFKKEFSYSFITSKNRKIYIRPTDAPDSICEFSMNKNQLLPYLSDKHVFTVYYAGKKYALNKNGKQITGPIDNLYYTSVPNFFLCEHKEKTGQSFLSLIDEEGKQIIPPAYSRILVNKTDSIIICCTAGVKISGADDWYNFAGERKVTSARHLDYVYKNYTIYKLHEPEVSYIIQDNSDKLEKPLKANWAYYLPGGIMVYRQGHDKYFFYNLKSDKKIPFDGRIYWFLNLIEDED